LKVSNISELCSVIVPHLTIILYYSTLASAQQSRAEEESDFLLMCKVLQGAPPPEGRPEDKRHLTLAFAVGCRPRGRVKRNRKINFT
jgi:hypothetical protein